MRKIFFYSTCFSILYTLLAAPWSAHASSMHYKDNSTKYVWTFLVLCGLIIFAQIMTALREPHRPKKSAEETLNELEELEKQKVNNH